jgi:hypothetical protein
MRNIAIAFIKRMVGPLENRPSAIECQEFFSELSFVSVPALEKIKKIAIIDLQEYAVAKQMNKGGNLIAALKNADEVWFTNIIDLYTEKQCLEIISELHDAGVSTDNKLFAYDPADGASPLQRVESIKSQVERRDPSQVRSYFYVANDVKESKQYREKQIHTVSPNKQDHANQFRLDDKVDVVPDDTMKTIRQDLMQDIFRLRMKYGVKNEAINMRVHYIYQSIDKLDALHAKENLTINHLKTELTALQSKMQSTNNVKVLFNRFLPKDYKFRTSSEQKVQHLLKDMQSIKGR